MNNHEAIIHTHYEDFVLLCTIYKENEQIFSPEYATQVVHYNQILIII